MCCVWPDIPLLGFSPCIPDTFGPPVPGETPVVGRRHKACCVVPSLLSKSTLPPAMSRDFSSPLCLMVAHHGFEGHRDDAARRPSGFSFSCQSHYANSDSVRSSVDPLRRSCFETRGAGCFSLDLRKMKSRDPPCPWSGDCGVSTIAPSISFYSPQRPSNLDLATSIFATLSKGYETALTCLVDHGGRRSLPLFCLLFFPFFSVH